MSQFTDFGLNPALLRAIKELGFENPMPIQEKGKDDSCAPGERC